MRSSRFHLVLLAAPLLLTACGDGWEAQRTTEILPYGGQRTAGSGVVYVRAKMLPEKEIVVEGSTAKGYEEIKSGDEVFAKAQTKGAAAPPPTKSVVEEPAKAVKEEAKETKKENIEPVKEKAAEVPAAVEPAASSAAVAEEPKKEEPVKKTYEQMLDEGSSPSPEKVEPHAGSSDPDKQSSLIGVPGSSSIDIVEVPEEVKIGSKTSNKAIMPVKAIRSPMMDVYNREIEAEKSLEEIYSNPF